MRISDWSSDVCSSDLMVDAIAITLVSCPPEHAERIARLLVDARLAACVNVLPQVQSIYRWNDAVERADESLLLIKHPRSEEHTSELQSLMRNSYAVFCLQKKKIHTKSIHNLTSKHYYTSTTNTS